MLYIWTFSPSSEKYLKLCQEFPTPADPANKWVKRFKKTDANTEKTGDLNNENNEINLIEVCNRDLGTPAADNQGIFYSETDQDILLGLETEPLAKFDSMLFECSKTPEIISKLAAKLSLNTVEKICNHLINKTDTDPSFLENFYVYFIPIFLKRENCRFSLDLLVNANKTYPDKFLKTINIIVKDLEIPNTLLNDFSHTLNEDSKLNIFSNILKTQLSPEHVQHNLFTIYTLYRDCKKNSSLQNDMETFLFEHCEHCSKENNFGKLLLNFLQEQKNYGAFRQSSLIEKMIEINRTSFRKPCLNVFKDI